MDSLWDDMEVPSESFHWSSWDSRTCYPRRAFIQGLSDDIMLTDLYLLCPDDETFVSDSWDIIKSMEEEIVSNRW